MNLDMCFLVDARDVIMCCTIFMGLGSPSLFRIWIKTTPLQDVSSLKKRLCITIYRQLKKKYQRHTQVFESERNDKSKYATNSKGSEHMVNSSQYEDPWKGDEYKKYASTAQLNGNNLELAKIFFWQIINSKIIHTVLLKNHIKIKSQSKRESTKSTIEHISHVPRVWHHSNKALENKDFILIIETSTLLKYNSHNITEAGER